MVLLGNLAVRAARVLELDPDTGMVMNATIPGVHQPNVSKRVESIAQLMSLVVSCR